MLVVFWLILNRTTLGYEVRAVGFNPDAAAYGGINVGRTTSWRWRSPGPFAGLAGALDMLGYLFQFGELDVQASQIGFLGIAVALLGRNTAVGTGIAALLFGALLYGTTRGARPERLRPEPRRQPDARSSRGCRALRRRRRARPLHLERRRKLRLATARAAA